MAVVLGLLGFLLVFPLAWLYFKPSVSAGDAAFAFAPLFQVPLKDLEEARFFERKFSIPADGRWKRIWRAWGDPGYVVAAISSDQRTTYCLDRLGIDLDVAVGSAPSRIESATEPLYGHLAECLPIGVKFEAHAGEQVTIKVRTKSGALPPGHLWVAAYWKSDIKDKLVGVSLDKEVRKPALVAGGVGLFLLVAACGLLLKRRRSN